MKLHQLGALAPIAVLLSVTACSSSGSKVDADAEFNARQAQLEQREADIRQREAALANAKQQPAVQATPVAGGADLLPPKASPGQCFTRVWRPAEYRDVQDRKLVSEASEKIEIIPAKYGKSTKRVVIQEASTKLVTVPATYKVVTERIMVKPAQSVIEEVPAVYETVTEKVIDKPAHTTWKKGQGPIQRIDQSTGEIMCLVDVPATYKTISKRVLKSPASTRSREIPASYKTVKRRVVDQQASTKTVEIPAKYGELTVTEEVRPAEERRIPIPAKYQTVSHRELVQDGEMEWREIMCETNTTPARVAKIQQALLTAGHNPGPIDGNIGPSTIRAVNAFQREKGLPVDQYLNVKTVQALGVSPK